MTFPKRAAVSHLIPARWAILLGAALCLPTASVARADQPHWNWQFDLSVDAPQATGDSFRVHLMMTLVGPKVPLPPQMVESRYRLAATRPDGSELPLTGTVDHPATEAANIAGAYSNDTTSFSPDENGQWTFSVWQLDGNTWTVAAQRRSETDKAVGSPPPNLPSAPSGAPSALTRSSSVQLDPSPAIVGQPVTITVTLEGYPDPTTLPVSLQESNGSQPIGAIQVSGGQGSLVWMPDQPLADRQAHLQIGTQQVSVVVLAAPENPAVGSDGTPPSDSAPTVEPAQQDSTDWDGQSG